MLKMQPSNKLIKKIKIKDTQSGKTVVIIKKITKPAIKLKFLI